MPTISTPSKIAATKGYGAEVIFSGSTSEERRPVEDVMKRTGAILVPPYDHPDIILGQGTMALEFEDQVREMVEKQPYLSVRRPQNADTTTDGEANGMKNGHFSRLKAGKIDGRSTVWRWRHAQASRPPSTVQERTSLAPSSFQGADDAKRGLATHKRIESVKTLTIADGLRTPVGEIPWSVISDTGKVRGVYAVSEEQIKAAMRLVLERMKVFVEPSAVVGLAVVLYDEGFGRWWRGKGSGGWDVGVVLSGGNTTVEAIAKLFEVEESRAERQEGKVGMMGSGSRRMWPVRQCIDCPWPALRYASTACLTGNTPRIPSINLERSAYDAEHRYYTG
jgi:threonine dehydratase